MINLKNKKNCTGCGACVSVCPKNAISLKWSDDGFLYPYIDKNSCIECRKCEKICFFDPTNKKYEVQCYSVSSNSDIVLKGSSSGGAFYELAKAFLDNDGVVYGVELNKFLFAKHIRVSSINDLYRIQKSKYIQSDMSEIYKEIVKDLKEGKKVLFSGTPCQVNAVYRFLGRDYDNLYTLDIICHGVPSPMIWQEYIREVEKNNNEKIVYADFRDKTYGWEQFSLKLKMNNKDITEIAGNNKYMKLFLEDKILRECCYKCDYKKKYRYSDFTLGDYWGIDKNDLSYNKNGVSIIFVRSPKGFDLLHKVKKNVSISDASCYKSLSINTSYFLSPIKPKARLTLSQIGYKRFYVEYDNNAPEKKNIIRRICRKLKVNYLARIIKKYDGSK